MSAQRVRGGDVVAGEGDLQAAALQDHAVDRLLRQRVLHGSDRPSEEERDDLPGAEGAEDGGALPADPAGEDDAEEGEQEGGQQQTGAKPQQELTGEADGALGLSEAFGGLDAVVAQPGVLVREDALLVLDVRGVAGELRVPAPAPGEPTVVVRAGAEEAGQFRKSGHHLGAQHALAEVQGRQMAFQGAAGGEGVGDDELPDVVAGADAGQQELDLDVGEHADDDDVGRLVPAVGQEPVQQRGQRGRLARDRAGAG
ncbi:hypothetical protein SBI_05171 [Streptomyces bingchenggensis BCW-1]|uniref:Uncharacterized protein n=1 Tax=Streptomyces bingchenggensis (strain BCW-1) TaxID=749414 RepID=D7C565_STRBB|nr:hypothetical protein SBI_05171 [Streptomyces bingchenggensis BCW-1]